MAELPSQFGPKSMKIGLVVILVLILVGPKAILAFVAKFLHRFDPRQQVTAHLIELAHFHHLIAKHVQYFLVVRIYVRINYRDEFYPYLPTDISQCNSEISRTRLYHR